MRIATPDLFKRDISYCELEEFFYEWPRVSYAVAPVFDLGDDCPDMA